MNETQHSDEALDEAPDTAVSEQPGRSVARGGIGVLVLLLASLGWYLLADRFTPYTSQARVEGYVVGVAPKVAGIITEVAVKNNARVSAGQVLFSIDQDQYGLALQRAQFGARRAGR